MVYKRKKKNETKSPIQQLVHGSRRERGRVPKLPERSDDPFALPCGERIEGERIDASVVDIKTERIRCPAVDIKKRTGDPSPLESSPEGETDRCVLESDGRLLI